MNRSAARSRLQLMLLAVLCITLVWVGAGYELYRSHQAHEHEAEVRTSVQAHVFAEYSRSTTKRLNEYILDIRTRWNGDWKAFSEQVRHTQENIDDLTFKVAVIDRNGILAFSNLAKPTDRTDLSEREHFRVHSQAQGADRLFISRPLLGKVSGKWSIQFTRPIFRNDRFDGVLVVSVSPEQFAGFARKLRLDRHSLATVVRDSGEIMARYPATESSLGQMLKDRPFLNAQAPVSGTYRQISLVDGQDRIFGFYRLPEYGLNFVLGESISDVFAPYFAHRNAVLTAAALVSALIASLFVILLRSLAAREASRQQLAAIFELSPDGFVSFDEDRRVMYASPAFLRMTGLKAPHITGLHETAFSDRLARECLPQARFSGVAALRNAQTVPSGAASAAGDPDGAAGPAAAPDGQRHRHLIELAGRGKLVLECGLRTSNTPPVSQILYFRNVTHETEVDRLKSEFLSTAAHELRTPMTSIFGFAELLLTREFEPADQRDFLNTIFQNSKLTISILNELLDLVRIEERRDKDFVLVRTEAGELLREIIAGFGVPKGRSAPVVRPTGAPLWVRVDRGKLTQAVGNVLSNAYKYSPGGGAVSVDVVAIAGEDGSAPRACIRVGDSGIGMTPEQLSHVSERFYRADTSGKIPGTGLGMSIVREVIELHGGALSLASRLGEGTTVTLTLPAET